MYNREYEYMAAITKAGTLSKAAGFLGITQPALSRFLQKEEAGLGTKLFQKKGAKLVLTYAGECYMESIQEILSIQSKMIHTISDIAKMEKGRIRVGVPSIRRAYTIFSVIPKFKEIYPSISIMLTEQHSSALEELLDDMELDLITINTIKKNEEFIYEKVADEEFVLAVNVNNPLIKKAKIKKGLKYPAVQPADLNGETFTMLGENQRIGAFAYQFFSTYRISYNTAMHTKALGSALESVACNLGSTFTPEVTLKYIYGSEAISYLSLDIPDNHYEYNIVYRKGAYLSPPIVDFIRLFKDNYTSLASNQK